MHQISHDKQSGMTLVEMTIAMGISAMVMFSLTQSIFYLSKNINNNSSKQFVNQEWTLINNYIQNSNLCPILFDNAVNRNILNPNITQPIHIALTNPTSLIPAIGTPTIPMNINGRTVQIPNPSYRPASQRYLLREGDNIQNNLKATSITFTKLANAYSSGTSNSFTTSAGTITNWPILANIDIELSNTSTSNRTNIAAGSVYKNTFALTLTLQAPNPNPSSAPSPWEVFSCSIINNVNNSGSSGTGNVYIPINNVNASNNSACGIEGSAVRDNNGLYVCTNRTWMQVPFYSGGP